ncbi:MAG: hypothetical protein Q4Q19_08625 [Methanobrevibacter sp.]|nr:hypothetical protein [Methanobrevibacter sp.]
MADTDVLTGVLITAVGIVLVYASLAYRLIDLIMIVGLLVTLFGLYKLLPVLLKVFSGSLSRKSGPKSIQTQLQVSNSKNSRNRDQIKRGAKNLSNRLQDSKKEIDSKTVLNTPKRNYAESINKTFDSYEKDDFKESQNSNDLYNPKPNIKPSKRRQFAYFSDSRNSGNTNQVYFTPNYEKPMRVTRRPKRKSEDELNLAAVPRRSREISQALANSSLEEYSEPEAPLAEDKYSITPNILDEDIIIPIRNDEYLEPTYNLSQSENTVYNNVIFDEDEVEESEFEFEDYITPIHNEEESVSDEMEDHLEGTFDPYESSVEILNDVDKGIAPQEIKKTDVEESSKEHQPRAKDTLGLDNIESFRKTLPRPTSVSSVADADDSKLKEDSADEEESKKPIQIDPNDPESLPIPKLLNSYVICDRGILTSQEAFEEVAKHSKEELLLQVQSINDLTDSFLSSLTNVKSRVIIQDEGLDDSNYKDLISSLMDKGVEIRTLSSIDSFNLISDDSYALLISNAVDEDSVEYGAVYNDEDSINNIKSLFESSWQLAKGIELNEKDES